MSWFDWLRTTSAPTIDHPVFNRIRAAHRPQSGSWLWETIEFVETPRGPASFTFDSGRAGPGDAHKRQFDHMLAKLDRLTEAAVPRLAAELKAYLEFGGLAFPDDPWAELEWMGGHLTGVERELEIHYGYRSWPDAMIIVYFEDDLPTAIQIDD